MTYKSAPFVRQVFFHTYLTNGALLCVGEGFFIQLRFNRCTNSADIACIPYLPSLLIILQVSIQIDLIDGGQDRIAKKILCVRLCLANPISCGGYTERRTEHILKFITEIVIGGLKGIIVLLYTEHQAKPLQRNNGFDYGYEQKPREVLRCV